MPTRTTDEPMVIVPLPMVVVSGNSLGQIITQSLEVVRFRYLVIPREIAKGFCVLAIWIGKHRQVVAGNGPIPATLFAGESDAWSFTGACFTKVELDHPIPLDFGLCVPGQDIRVVVQNITPNTWCFAGALFGVEIQ